MTEQTLVPSQIGIELAELLATESGTDDGHGYKDTAGRHRTAPQYRAYLKRHGENAVREAGKLIGQISRELLSQTLSEIDGTLAGGNENGNLTISTLDLSFSVKLSAGSGKAIEALIAADAESTVQVSVTFLAKNP